MTGSVTHFEIYAEDDPNELATFYQELFDWQIDKVPGIDYFRIQTARPKWGHPKWAAARPGPSAARSKRGHPIRLRLYR